MEYWMQRPCDACRSRKCRELECSRWRKWYLQGWEAAVNRCAWAIRDRQGRQPPAGFTYALPHEDLDPCRGCRCEDWCDTPCSARIKWWDARIGRLRQGLR